MPDGICASGKLCQWEFVPVGNCASGNLCQREIVPAGSCARWNLCQWEVVPTGNLCQWEVVPVGICASMERRSLETYFFQPVQNKYHVLLLLKIKFHFLENTVPM